MNEMNRKSKTAVLINGDFPDLERIALFSSKERTHMYIVYVQIYSAKKVNEWIGDKCFRWF